MSILKSIVDWLDIRLGVRKLLAENLTRYNLPGNINIWYTMGTVVLILFTVQFVTGILLLVYYIPDPEKAAASVEFIVNKVPYGWLIRSFHAVGSNIIVVALLVHMISVLYMGSYKKPREITWLIGFTLFNLALFSCLTGYLLPWSQLSFWATTVTTNVPGSIPIIGEQLVRLVRGGEMVSGSTLGRFFTMHVIVFPLILIGGIGVHLFFVRRIGISKPPFGDDFTTEPSLKTFQHQEHPGGIPFFPNFMIKELAVFMLFGAALTAVVFFAPDLFIPLAAYEPANQFVTPEHIKPEWYFLWAYQTLKIFPNELLGLMMQAVMMTLIALVPFIDQGPERRPKKRPVFVACFFGGILLFTILSIWGHYS